jgi:hypothetical protein
MKSVDWLCFWIFLTSWAFCVLAGIAYGCFRDDYLHRCEEICGLNPVLFGGWGFFIGSFVGAVVVTIFTFAESHWPRKRSSEP